MKDVIVLIGGVVLLLVGLLAVRKGRRATARLAEELGGKASGSAVSGAHQGRTFRILEAGRRRGELILASQAAPCSFTASQRGPVGRFAARIGYAPPIPSGDRAFDERWLIESTDPVATELLLGSPSVRATLDALGKQVTQLRRHQDNWIVAFRPASPDESGAVHIRVMLEHVVAFDDVFPSCSDSAPQVAKRFSGVKVALWLASGLLFVGFMLSLRGGGAFTDRGAREAFHDIAWSGLASLVVLIAAVPLCAGRPASHRRLGEWLLYAIFLIPGGALFLLLALNGLLDSPLQRVEARVLATKASQDSIHVTLSSWHADGEKEGVALRASDFSSIQAGFSRLALDIAPGFLGYERVRSASLLDP